jgi:tRNA pseudouridine55 synthase
MKHNPLCIPIYKHVGETPLAAIDRYISEHISFPVHKRAYAGRLDPMAEGIILALLNEETKNINIYLSLEKTYEATIALGFSTDTYDALGKITREHISDLPPTKKIKETLRSFEGPFTFALPPFSSYKIQGKPLFHWARKGDPIAERPPQKTTPIFSIDNVSIELVPIKTLCESCITKIETVNGDFRQKEIIEQWKMIEGKYTEKAIPLITATIRCGSGTYIRSLAHELGKKLTAPAMLYALKRTKLGPYTADRLT